MVTEGLLTIDAEQMIMLNVSRLSTALGSLTIIDTTTTYTSLIVDINTEVIELTQMFSMTLSAELTVHITTSFEEELLKLWISEQSSKAHLQFYWNTLLFIHPCEI